MQKLGVRLFALLLAGCGAAAEEAGSPPTAGAAGSAGIEAPEAIDELIRARRYRAALAEIDARLAQPQESPGDPASVVLLDQRVRVLRELGLLQQALDQVLALRALAPEEARFAYEAGELALHLSAGAERQKATQLLQTAREQFAAARQLAPRDWRPAVAEAALLLRGKPPGTAAADALLAPFLEGADARVEAIVLHAHVVEAGGDPRAALAAFERALALEPGRLDALCNAARLAAAGGDPALELAYLQRARSAAERSDAALVREIDRRIAGKNR